MRTAEKFNMGPTEISWQKADLRKFGDGACLNIRLAHVDTERAHSILSTLNFVVICYIFFINVVFV